MLGTGIMGLLYGMSRLGQVVGGTFGDLLVFVGLQGRLDDFIVGIVDSSSIVYFVSLVCLCLCLFLAWRVLELRRWR